MKVVFGVLAALVFAALWMFALHFADTAEQARLAEDLARRAASDSLRARLAAEKTSQQAEHERRLAVLDAQKAQGISRRAEGKSQRAAAELRTTQADLTEARGMRDDARAVGKRLQESLEVEKARNDALTARNGELLKRIARLEDAKAAVARDHRSAAAMAERLGGERDALAKAGRIAGLARDQAVADREAAEASARRAETLRRRMAAARDRSLAEATAAKKERDRAMRRRQRAMRSREAAVNARDHALAQAAQHRDAAARNAQRLEVARGEAAKAFSLLDLAQARSARDRAARDAALQRAAIAENRAEQAENLATQSEDRARVATEAREQARADARKAREERDVARRGSRKAQREVAAAHQERETISTRLIEARAEKRRLQKQHEETLVRLRKLDEAGQAAEEKRKLLQAELVRQREAAEKAARQASEALKRIDTLQKEQAKAKETSARNATVAMKRIRQLEKEKEAATQQGSQASSQLQRAMASYRRLADARVAEELKESADDLWPALPKKLPEMERWLEQAKGLLGRRQAHAQRLREIRQKAEPWTEEQKKRDRKRNLREAPRVPARLKKAKATAQRLAKAGKKQELAKVEKRIAQLERRLTRRRTWVFKEAAYQFHAEVLAELMKSLREVERLAKEVSTRREFARTVEKRSLKDPAARWKQTAARIADTTRSPIYRGLNLSAQVGLVPLGPDPESGLEEFAHLASGTVPRRNAKTNRLELDENSAIVLVLLPGGGFRMGSSPPDDGGKTGAPNLDPYGTTSEGPVHSLNLAAFFVGKHEITQAQWERLAKKRPSTFVAGTQPGGRVVSRVHPVEHVSWLEAREGLRRADLTLPTEAQWEYACRAGTGTVFHTGAAPRSLAGAANLADEGSRAWFPATWTYEAGLTDGHGVHAPVGSFKPNAFGLHDLHGNVAEWCRDALMSYTDSAQAGTGLRTSRDAPLRVHRGGSYARPAIDARSAARAANTPDYRFSDLGLRAARAIR